MRKILTTLFLTGFVCTACIDRDYDLNKLTTDNITIGDETSEYRLPLVRVHVSLDEIANDGVQIDQLFEEAKIWLPKQLPDGDWVDLQKIANDVTYLTDLLDALTTQLMTDDAKFAAIGAEVWQKYRSAYLQLLGIPSSNAITEADFITLFRTTYRSDATLRQQLAARLRTDAADYLKGLRVEPVSYQVGRIDLSDQVVDMLAKNLDKADVVSPKNTLHIYGSIASKLPLSLGFTANLNPASVQLSSQIEAVKGAGEIAETRLLEADLRQIVDGITIHMPIVLQRYYPSRNFDLSATRQIEIDLRLVKRGGLKFDL